MSRTLQLTIAVSGLLVHHISAQTTIVSILDVGDGPTPISVIDNQPISDPPITGSVINAAPTGTTYFALPSFDPSDIANDGPAALTSAYGLTITIAPSAYDMVGAAGQVSLHCDMSGTVPRVCTNIGPGVETSDEGQITTSTITPGSTDYYYSPLTVNAGLEKLASATPTSSSTAAAASSSAPGSTVAPGPTAPWNTSVPSTSAAITPLSTPAATTPKFTGAAGRNAVVGVGGVAAGLVGAMLNGV